MVSWQCMVQLTAHTASLVADRATKKLKEERMVVAAAKTIMALKLHKVFRSWLILTMNVSDGSSEDEHDGVSFRTQQRRSPSPGSQHASEARSVFGTDSGSRQHSRMTSPSLLDTSADSEAFASPQSVEALTPVRRTRDSVSPVKTGRGSLSPVQLLRRAEFELRSDQVRSSRTPSPS